MGKQGKERKRRRLEYTVPLPKVVALAGSKDTDTGHGDHDIAPQDLACTARTLQLLVESPKLMKAPECKGVRTALYALRQPNAGTSLTAQVSLAIREHAYLDALCHLAAMRIRQQAVPLGALQRWIRDLDALDGNPLVLRVIDAVMRTVDDTAAPEHDMCPDVNESNGVRRHGSWSCLPPSGISLYEEIKRGTLVDPSRSEELRSRFKVVQETAGPNRLPPNLHPAILYSSTPNTVPLPPESTVVTSHSVPGLSNATFLSSILTHAECRQIISCAEAVGMLPDQPASGSAVTLASVLAHNFYWLADETFISALFQRVKAHLPEIVQGGQLRGLNRRFRLYRYTKEAVYRPHIDGAWPPSGIDAAGGYVYDASPPGKPQSSRYTFLIYLNDDFSCGETTFFTPSAKEGILDVRPVRPIAGCALVFPHGDTIGSLVHMGSEVGATEEVKYIIRTDVVYDIV